MDDILKKSLEFSNYKHTFSLQHKVLKEKVHAKLTYGYGGGIFKIDRELINFVEFLISKNRTQDIVLLDINDNPVLIDNLEKFNEEILDRYFSSTLDYFNNFQSLKKARSVEKLADV